MASLAFCSTRILHLHGASFTDNEDINIAPGLFVDLAASQCVRDVCKCCMANQADQLPDQGRGMEQHQQQRPQQRVVSSVSLPNRSILGLSLSWWSLRCGCSRLAHSQSHQWLLSPLPCCLWLSHRRVSAWCPPAQRLILITLPLPYSSILDLAFFPSTTSPPPLETDTRRS